MTWAVGEKMAGNDGSRRNVTAGGQGGNELRKKLISAKKALGKFLICKISTSENFWPYFF